MRNALLSATALLAVAFAPVFGGEPENKTCICGMPADATKTVEIKDGDSTHTYAVCSDGCATKLKAMTPAEAAKAVKAHNKDEQSKKSG